MSQPPPEWPPVGPDYREPTPPYQTPYGTVSGDDLRDHGYYGIQPAPRKSRTPLILASAAVLVVMLLGWIGWLAYDRFAAEDSGVAACKSIRDNQAATTAGKPQKMTDEAYRAARQQFADSDDPNLRLHGTRLIDVVFQYSQSTDPDASALLYARDLMEHATGLASACADHGVMVNLNP